MAFLALIPEILAAVLEALGLLSTINGVVQAIRSILNLNDNSSWANKVLANTATSSTLLNDPTYGLGAIHDTLANITALIVALGDPMQAGASITLPTTPPPGYGSGDSSDIATAVWNYFIISASQNASDCLANAGIAAVNLDRAAVSLPTAYMPPILLGGPWANPINPPPVDSLGQSVDFTTILPTDLTPADWMNRVNPTLHVWEMHNDYARFIEDGSGFYYTLNISQWDFERIRDGFTAKVPPQPPIWPGTDKVTYQEGREAFDGDTFTQLLDGVDVLITAVPAGSSQYGWGPIQAYSHLGAIAFFDDAGHYEAPQVLNFVQSKYLPKSFQHAGGATIKLKAGTDLTWYPFTINP